MCLTLRKINFLNINYRMKKIYIHNHVQLYVNNKQLAYFHYHYLCNLKPTEHRNILLKSILRKAISSRIIILALNTANKGSHITNCKVLANITPDV